MAADIWPSIAVSVISGGLSGCLTIVAMKTDIAWIKMHLFRLEQRVDNLERNRNHGTNLE
jgi:hypothetical protein